MLHISTVSPVSLLFSKPARFPLKRLWRGWPPCVCGSWNSPPALSRSWYEVKLEVRNLNNFHVLETIFSRELQKQRLLKAVLFNLSCPGTPSEIFNNLVHLSNCCQCFSTFFDQGPIFIFKKLHDPCNYDSLHNNTEYKVKSKKKFLHFTITPLMIKL